jgi:hypothetical protein
MGKLKLVKRLAVEEPGFQVTNVLTPFTMSLYSKNGILILKTVSDRARETKTLYRPAAPGRRAQALQNGFGNRPAVFRQKSVRARPLRAVAGRKKEL